MIILAACESLLQTSWERANKKWIDVRGQSHLRFSNITEFTHSRNQGLTLSMTHQPRNCHLQLQNLQQVATVLSLFFFLNYYRQFFLTQTPKECLLVLFGLVQGSITRQHLMISLYACQSEIIIIWKNTFNRLDQNNASETKVFIQIFLSLYNTEFVNN